MGAVVRIWLKSLIDTFQWGRLHSAVEKLLEKERMKFSWMLASQGLNNGSSLEERKKT